VIFFHDAEQEATARKVRDELDDAGKFPHKIVTQIAPAPEFYRGEEYHQRYFEKKGIAPTCHTR
jgi:peptide-methionine (S)-S-oxide reductase